MNYETGYNGYQNMVSTTVKSLNELQKICKKVGMENTANSLKESEKKLSAHRFSVGILGEFKRGKSTVINSLLGQEIMPADVLPCSATMNRVTYDMTKRAEIIMRDGTVKNTSVEDLKQYVTKLTQKNAAQAEQVDEAVVYYPCAFCQNGVDIVDTPGLNDDERMNNITENIIPKLDVIIMVITPDSPFSMSEAEFVRNKVMTSGVSRIIFLINKIDQIDEEDRDRVLESIKEKIQLTILEKMDTLYGEGSEEYENTKRKLAGVRLFPFSARDALKGKIKGDSVRIERSGTIEFEEALTKMLTEERGALELGGAISLLIKSARETREIVISRKGALELSGEEFEKKQNEALDKIKELRKKKTEEKNKLKVTAFETKEELAKIIDDFYPTLESRMCQSIENTYIDVETCGTQSGQENAAEVFKTAIANEMDLAVNEITEKIETKLGDIIGNESDTVGQFLENVSNSVIDTVNNIAPKGEDTMVGSTVAEGIGLLGTAILSGGGMVLPGLGGLIEGYKVGGLGGAALGMGVGAAASIATVLLIGSMGIVGLPLVFAASLAGSGAGRAVTKAVFRKSLAEKNLKKIREAACFSVSEMMKEIRADGNLEKWMNERVDIRFDELAKAMEIECEKLLNDTENSIEIIRRDLAQNEAERKNLEKNYDEILGNIDAMANELNPIAEKVFAVWEQKK